MKKPIKTILEDLIENLKYHQENMKKVGDDYYHYDRGGFIKQIYDWERKINIYDVDLETISTLIIQTHLFGHIIHENDDGRDIRNNKIIKEKTE